MVFKECSYSVLIISNAEKFNSVIAQMLPESEYYPISRAQSVGEARRMLLEKSFDIIIINSPLPDEPGLRLAIDISTESSAGVLLFVRSEQYSETSAKLGDFGALTLPKPCSPQLVRQSLGLLGATRERLRLFESKTASLEEKMEEIRLVNRAKWALIDACGLSEDEAHKQIERKAMEMRITKKAAAEEIINSCNK